MDVNTDKLYSAHINPGIKNWYDALGLSPGTLFQKERVMFPENIAKGYAEVHTIEPGFCFRLVDYVVNTDFQLAVDSSENFVLNIYFYQFFSDEKVIFQMGNNVIETESNPYRAIVLSNSTVAQKLTIKKGTEVKGLTIELSEEWMMQNVYDADGKNISLLKNNNFLLSILTAKFQKVLDDIFSRQRTSLLPRLYIKSRVLRILNGYLENILKSNAAEPLLSISSKDFESLLHIENILLENYKNSFPKIEKLARIALMSESKLKKIYKQAFGMGPYEYYQKNRMHKARELLNSGEYTVSQVGTIIGYANLSNFSTSFKKEFNQLPKDSKPIPHYEAKKEH